MRIDLSCGRCGKNRFAFPDSGGDEAIVVCGDCGQPLGTLGDIKRQVEAAVLSPRRRDGRSAHSDRRRPV